jgi:hypothetical protein
MNGLYIISFQTVTSGNIEHLQHMYTMSALSCRSPRESYKRCHLRGRRIPHCLAVSPRYVQSNTVSVEGHFLIDCGSIAIIACFPWRGLSFSSSHQMYISRIVLTAAKCIYCDRIKVRNPRRLSFVSREFRGQAQERNRRRITDVV